MSIVILADTEIMCLTATSWATVGLAEQEIKHQEAPKHCLLGGESEGWDCSGAGAGPRGQSWNLLPVGAREGGQSGACAQTGWLGNCQGDDRV